MLQRGMKCPPLLLVQIAIAVPSPSEWPLLMAPERASAQPGSLRVSKTSCCFSVAESSGEGCDVPGRGLRAAHLPCTVSSGSSPPPSPPGALQGSAAPGGPRWERSKVGFADFLP